MVGRHPGHRRVVLRGRRDECAVLDRLLHTARSGQSGVLVLRGEAGIGKSALLEYVVDRAVGFRIARTSGVESEMELPFAALHQLCAQMLDRLDRLPEPQAGGLRAAFGLSSGVTGRVPGIGVRWMMMPPTSSIHRTIFVSSAR